MKIEGRKRAGNAAILMMGGLLIVVILILFIIPGFGGSSTLATTASPIAQEISGLPRVNVYTCDDVRNVAPQWNLTIGEINSMAGTLFDKIGLNKLDCDHMLDYVPLVGAYDSLIISAKQFNSGNDTSVRAFYLAGVVFGADATLLDAKVAYKLSYSITGYLNDLLGLRAAAGVCGYACYGKILSSIHWFVRGYANEILPQFETWVVQNLSNLPQNW